MKHDNFYSLLPKISGPIAGIGVDILYTSRIEKALTRSCMRFAEKILGLEELQNFYIRRNKNIKKSIKFLSSRFAAKEAFSKAVGIGINIPVRWKEVQIINSNNGRPTLFLSPKLFSWYNKFYGKFHVSISDESDMVIAFVVIEHKDKSYNFSN
ncbi:MAG: holo-ACP synthase [Bordetella sp.]|nr:MAG: holo-ACP synthase [Bordetella sp.]